MAQNTTTAAPWRVCSAGKVWGNSCPWPIAQMQGGACSGDAALIAAAPDLYAALSALLTWASEHTDDEGRAEFRQAAEALARARGEG